MRCKQSAQARLSELSSPEAQVEQKNINGTQQHSFGLAQSCSVPRQMQQRKLLSSLILILRIK